MVFLTGEDGLKRVKGGALSPRSWLLGGVVPILTVQEKVLSCLGKCLSSQESTSGLYTIAISTKFGNFPKSKILSFSQQIASLTPHQQILICKRNRTKV